MAKIKSNDNVGIYFDRFNFLVNKYGKERVYECVEQLGPENKESFFCYFGLNGEKLSVKEIARKYNQSESTVRYHVSFSISKIADLLGQKESIPVTVVNKEEEFFNRYKDYSREEIMGAVDKMSGLGKEVVLSYYGIGRECLKPAEIGFKYDIAYHTVFNYLKGGLKVFERNLNNDGDRVLLHKPEQFYSKFKGISKEAVDARLSELNPKTQEILSDFYGLNGNAIGIGAIAKKYNLSADKVTEGINKVVGEMSKLMMEESKEIGRKRRFYSKFVGCSEEEVDQAILNLDDRAQIILKLYYGIGCSSLTMSAIGEKCGLSRARVDQIIKREIEILKENLKTKEEKRKEKMDEFFQKFEGYSKEDVESALYNLKKRDRQIIRYFYGFEDELLDAQQLANKFNISYSSVRSVLTVKMDEMLDVLKDPFLRIGVSKKKFYEKFERYTKVEIDAALDRLESDDKEMLSLYYGLNGDRLTGKELSNRLKIGENHVYYYLTKAIKMIEDYLVSSISYTVPNKNDFYDLFKGFDVKLVKRAMWGLNKKDRDIIIKYYGLKGESISIDDIALNYNLDKTVISQMIENALKDIRKGIIEIKNREFFIEVGCSEETVVKRTLKNLKENDYKLICLYYGLNGDNIMSQVEISEKLNVRPSIVEKKIAEVIDIIKSMLPVSKR